MGSKTAGQQPIYLKRVQKVSRKCPGWSYIAHSGDFYDKGLASKYTLQVEMSTVPSPVTPVYKHTRAT